jgi:hypothetical protein
MESIASDDEEAQVGAVLCSTAISLRPFASDAYLGKRYIVSKDIG